jgi:hypothetical protein
MNPRHSSFRLFNSNPGIAIPVEFETDLPLFLPIKIQMPDPMKNPLLVPEKPSVTDLFRIAPGTNELTPRRASTARQTILGEMMLDAKRLEEVLKDVVRKKKAAARRMSTGRFNKMLSLNEGQRA